MYVARGRAIIAETNTARYGSAVVLLGNVRGVMGAKSLKWRKLVVEIRHEHARKRRFIQELSSLDEAPAKRVRKARP